jgi:hypothetical protein
LIQTVIPLRSFIFTGAETHRQTARQRMLYTMGTRNGLETWPYGWKTHELEAMKNRLSLSASVPRCSL